LHSRYSIELFFGDISDCKEIENTFDCVYLDFCYSFDSSIEVINELKQKISQSKLFGVTFCLRNYSPEEGDYQFEIQKKIMDVLNLPLKPLYGYTYRDNHRKGAVMMTILFEVMEVKNE